MKLIHTLCISLLLSACATKPLPLPAEKTNLAATPDFVMLLPPVPARGSAAEIKDIAQMLDLQAKRTQAMCDFAQADVDTSLKRFLAPLSLTLNGDTVQTDELIKLLFTALRSASNTAKNHYKRPRPYDYDAGLVPCINKVPASSYSYPSGHTASGYVIAAVLAEVIPEQKAKWFDRAAEYGRSRSVGGVHFPTDVEAGRLMGLILADQELRNPNVHTQLELARPELRRALGY
jgi:acid phosphatase (class A)